MLNGVKNGLRDQFTCSRYGRTRIRSCCQKCRNVLFTQHSLLPRWTMWHLFPAVQKAIISSSCQTLTTVNRETQALMGLDSINFTDQIPSSHKEGILAPFSLLQLTLLSSLRDHKCRCIPGMHSGVSNCLMSIQSTGPDQQSKINTSEICTAPSSLHPLVHATC